MAHQTGTQIASAKLIAGAKSTLKADVPEVFDNTKYNEPVIYLIARDIPFDFLGAFAELKTGVADEMEKVENRKQFYLLWDAKEFKTFKGEFLSLAIEEFVTLLRERRTRERWHFYATPLIISGFIAVVLLLILAGLMISGRSVPPELWSIFTAIVAFYFGREGWTAMRDRGNAS